MTVARPELATSAGDASSGKLISALLFAGAVISISFRVGTGHFGSGYETVAVARSLAEHGQFADPYRSLATGPTAHVAPFYPAFLALLLRLFGYTAAFGQAASYCSMLVHGLNAAMLPRISELFFHDRRPGICGAALTIVLPLYFFFPQFEVIYLATALMLFCLASYRLIGKGGGWRGLATGVAFGSVVMLNPASLSVTGPWLAYACWRYLKQRRAAFVLSLALGTVAALAPWTWRNYQQFHTLFLVRDNLGLELYVSNTDLAQATYIQNRDSGLYATRHPDPSVSEAREVVRLGEIEYNRERMAATRQWVLGNPSKFLALSVKRARMFWFPIAEGYPLYAFGIALVTILSVGGFVLLAIRRESILLFLGAVQLLYPILYCLVQNDPRFRAPILWISLLGTGYFIVSLWTRFFGPGVHSEGSKPAVG